MLLILKKNFAVLLLCPFCLLLSLLLSVCVAEAACGDGTIDGTEECDPGPPLVFRGISPIPPEVPKCKHLGDTTDPITGTSEKLLICDADCLRDDSMCSGGFQAPPKPGDVPEDFKGSILNITNWLLGFVTMIAVLAIVWGGINYLTSAGDEDKARTGKKTLTYALLGLVVIGIAYAIVNVVVKTILG